MVVLFCSSCNSVLDIEPKDRITNIWESEALVEAYINGMYVSLEHGFCFDMWGTLTDEMHAVHDAGTWEVQRGWLTEDNVETTARDDVRPTFNKWAFAFKEIRKINEALQFIEDASISKDKRQRMLGEMLFIRSYLYAELLWRYGGVPIITTTYNLGEDYSGIKRSSYDDVVEFIVENLNEAVDLLPGSSNSEKGRATKEACFALKSRVLLYAASEFNNPDNNLDKWIRAKEATEVLIDKEFYLADNYQKLFLEDSEEVIFARYFTISQNHNINGWAGTNSLNGGGSNAPTENIVMDYEMENGELPYSISNDLEFVVNPKSGFDINNPYKNRDPRFYASILYDGSVFQNHILEKYNGGIDSPQSDVLGWNASVTGYNLLKFLDESRSVNLRTDDLSTNPWIFFRYGEVLLNYAEILYELGDEDKSRFYLNKIRDRAGMPVINDIGVALRERIRHERRIELAFEGHRYYDVRRWKILEEVFEKGILKMEITKNKNGIKNYEVKRIFDREFHDKLYLLPIPKSEIDKSKGILIQNPGY